MSELKRQVQALQSMVEQQFQRQQQQQQQPIIIMPPQQQVGARAGTSPDPPDPSDPDLGSISDMVVVVCQQLAFVMNWIA